MWSEKKRQNGSLGKVAFLLVFAVFMGGAWLFAGWAEQNRGLSFGSVFAVCSLIGALLTLAASVNIPEEIQKSQQASMQHKHTA